MRIRAVVLVSFATVVAVSCRSQALSVPQLTISKETTYITEPLRDDGTPDYSLLLNRKYGAGVTPENNAAVPLLGKGLLGRPIDVLRPMGIDPAQPPEELVVVGDTLSLVGFEASLRARADANGSVPGIGKLPEDFSRAFGDQRRRALSAPWSDEEAPLAAAWLEANEPSLTRLAEIVRTRPRFWIPMAQDHGPDTPIPSSMQWRTLTDVLRARALRSVSRRQDEAAQRDTATGLRLAALLDQSTGLVERLVATSLRSVIAEAIVTLANPPRSRAAARALVGELRRLPRRLPYDEALENERLQVLAAYVDLYRAARQSSSAWNARVEALAKVYREMAVGLGITPWQSSFARVPPWAIDWDELLRTSNRCHMNPACDAELNAAHTDLEPATLGNLVETARADAAARRRIGRALLTEGPTWGKFGATFSPEDVKRPWNEIEGQFRMALVSAAAAVRRIEDGRYPPDAATLNTGSASPGFDPGGSKAGYTFHYVASADGSRFSYTAAPEKPTQAGTRGFCADSSGRLAQTTDGTAPRIVDGLCDPAAMTRVARRLQEASKPPKP